MVGAVVAERKARRGRPRGPAEDLVSEADAENRDPADRLAGQLHRSVEHRRIARSVREHQAVRAGGFDVPPGRRIRQHHHATAAFAKGAENVALHSVIDDGDRQPRAVRVIATSQFGRQRIEPLLD